MAVAAELINQQTDTFNWDLAEAQFAQYQLIDAAIEPTNYERPPESEIYGRSLSTIYRLGAFAAGKSQAEIIYSPEAAQARAEFYTSVEEGFGTDSELGGGLEVRDFDERPVANGRVLAKDLKTPVSAMTRAGLECAIETAKKDERFKPQLIRSIWDDKNALIVDDMVQGKTGYNTRIVPSLCPKEAIAKSGPNYWRNVGYVPHLERGFLQFYYASEDGCVSGSLSFDGSDIDRLREVFSKYGVNIPEDETTDNCLQYAITGTLSEQAAKELALELANQLADPKYKKTTNTVEVTSEHHAIMDTVFNESYIHVCESLAQGCQTSGVRKLVAQLADKAAHFNSRYANALYRMRSNGDRFTDDDSIVLHELLVYSTIEMMRALHLRAAQTGAKINSPSSATYPDIAYLQSLDSAAFQNALGGFGADGARNNRTYSACGLAISLGEGENPQAVFGGKDCPEVKDGQITRCPHCKKIVRAIVPDRESIYCSNKKCKLAAPDLAAKK
ncbi:MAG TPA: hypothetical protein VK712_01150 [Verrucomicrobiae bacterium]|jgi:hypothetical protein|nr:hypothetical protein [Verrucomicrobiae bacterium]